MRITLCAGCLRHRRAEKYRDHPTESVALLVSADGDEAHALRKANDFCHARHFELAPYGEGTMKAASFQGAQ